MGGRVWDGRWGQVGSRRWAKANIYMQTAVLCHQYIDGLDWHNSQGRPGLLLESVWHPMQSYKCLSGAKMAMKFTLVV